MEILQKAGVAAMPSFSAPQIYGDPHLKARGFATEVMHPVIGRQVVQSPPWKLSATPAKVERHSPLFGEHHQYVFGQLLDLSAEEIATLEEEEVLY
jgi:crotonobetainyl-CoA:carnitine CoA-transferase CaiB-like acyl-CoA transferase